MKVPRIFATAALAALLFSCSSGGDEAPPAPGTGAPADEKAAAPIELPPPTSDEPGFLTAFADADEVLGNVPHTVKLGVAVVEGTGNPPFSYKWDFGDATEFSTEPSPTHTYKIPGSFRASVIVTDSKGDIDQDYVDITVNEDVEYTVTPEQLREAVPMDEFTERAKQERMRQQGQGAPGTDAARAPGDSPNAPAPGAPAAGASPP